MNSVFDIVPRNVAIEMICGNVNIVDSGYFNNLLEHYSSETPYSFVKTGREPDDWILSNLEQELGVYA
jgi:hypothetical protein